MTWTIPAKIKRLSKRRQKIAVRKMVHNRLSKLAIVGHTIDRIMLDEVRGAIVDVLIQPIRPVHQITIKLLR